MEKKFYLTEKGLERVKKEYKDLKNIKLLKTGGDVPKILHSEELNPEYLAFQEDLNFLDSRIAEMDYILKNVELVKIPPKDKRNVINVGAKILVDVGGQKDEFEIVGTLEANPAIGKISNESPVGRALLGHKIGEEVVVSSPIKTLYKIKKVTYLS